MIEGQGLEIAQNLGIVNSNRKNLQSQIEVGN